MINVLGKKKSNSDYLKFNKRAAWLNTGLKITTDQGFLTVEDLNPETKIRNRISKWELFKLGLWLVKRSVFPTT